MADPMYDVIVVGAGVEGSGTGYQLSKRGVKVLMLEQFPLPTSRGSSHGSSRIIRKAHPHQTYTKMVGYCVEEWKRIQQEVGETIFRNIGYMNIGHLSDKALQDDINSMKINNASYEYLSPEAFRQRFPNLSYGDDVGAVYDHEGGILYADKCLQSLQKLFVKHGGVLKDGEKVENIIPGETVRVVTSKHTYTGRSIVLCCGPWTNKVLKSVHLELPLQPTRISVYYWPEKVPGSYSSKHMMPFVEMMEGSVAYPYYTYGLPSDEYPGLFKLCLHQGPEAADPEKRDTVDSQWVVNLLKKYVRNHFPGLVPEPSIVEPCYYTMAPDKDFILDCHPQWKNIVIGAGFSGHGFKHGPAVGDILADLALGTKPKFDTSRFLISRFDTAKKSKL